MAAREGGMSRLLQASVNWLPHGIRRHIHRVPGLAGFQRWLIARFGSGRAFIHRIQGGPASTLRFEVTLPADKAIWTGTFELEFARVLQSTVKAGDVCYDIGGYRGYMSGVMALAGAAKVLVFEPLVANQRALRKFCELNPGLPLEVLPLAVGDADGTARFKLMPDHSMGKLSTSSFQWGAAALEEQEVEVRRLDSLVAGGRIPPPNLLKIDVEGAEYQVLKGAAELLRKYRPRLCLEAHSAELEIKCRQNLEALGYSVKNLEPNIRGEEQPRHLLCLP